jgi:hypothetical protein
MTPSEENRRLHWFKTAISVDRLEPISGTGWIAEGEGGLFTIPERVTSARESLAVIDPDEDGPCVWIAKGLYGDWNLNQKLQIIAVVAGDHPKLIDLASPVSPRRAYAQDLRGAMSEVLLADDGRTLLCVTELREDPDIPSSCIWLVEADSGTILFRMNPDAMLGWEIAWSSALQSFICRDAGGGALWYLGTDRNVGELQLPETGSVAEADILGFSLHPKLPLVSLHLEEEMAGEELLIGQLRHNRVDWQLPVLLGEAEHQAFAWHPRWSWIASECKVVDRSYLEVLDANGRPIVRQLLPDWWSTSALAWGHDGRTLCAASDEHLVVWRLPEQLLEDESEGEGTEG